MLENTPDEDVVAVLNAEPETVYQRLRRLYCSGQLTDAGLNNAVRLRMITRAEADAIPNECATL